MLRIRHKSATIYSVIFFFLILLSGCAQERKDTSAAVTRPLLSLEASEQSATRTDIIEGQDYTLGSSLKVLEANALTISEVSSPQDSLSDFSGSYYIYNSINGLVRPAVENKINNAIAETAQFWAKERPVTEDYPEDGFSDVCVEGAAYGVSTTLSWNYCDYLSGIMTRTIDYYEPSDRSHSRFTYISPINYDLRTGNEFTLKSLFTEDCNYMSVISRAVLQYGKDNGLSMVGFMGLEKEPVFCLSRAGLVVYMDDSYEKLGLMRNTPVTISFDDFGNDWAIGRACDRTIYKDPGDPSYILLRQNGRTILTEETAYFDEGERFRVNASFTYPEGFPTQVFTDAQNYINVCLPLSAEAAQIRKDANKVYQMHFDLEGIVIGNYYCVALNGNRIETGDPEWNAIRYYIYDNELQPVNYADLFAAGYDSDALISRLATEVADDHIYNGYLFETEISMSDIEVILDTQELRFSTNPVRLSHTQVESDGTETTLTEEKSLSFSVSYDEIGIGNLKIFGQ